MIDVDEQFFVRIKGFTQGQWVELATSKANMDLLDVPDDKVEEELEKALDQFNDVINHAYKENNNGYIQLGNTSISILRFDAIEVLYVQDGREFDFTGFDR